MEPLIPIPHSFCNLIEITFGLVLGLVLHNAKLPIFLVLKKTLQQNMGFLPSICYG
jgi:hypothetical protein